MCLAQRARQDVARSVPSDRPPPHSCPRLAPETPETLRATADLEKAVVPVRVLMRAWPHFSLSGRKCGKLTGEISRC